ncbi:transglycosylase domain-containing protein [Nocardia terpenica]|uniref:Penicillin-binding protein n=1 Tax=Nocardia terpenica TaxID=455432 RepID=A0A164IJ22_9NOCA|nr:transglycosylase domain-containing protein [Nocardia terpenica]KZM69496.1 penicillin-binding protein [Nocardia terpenica]NQE89217.1 penicillin-binding protein [Nocardia terpenica]
MGSNRKHGRHGGPAPASYATLAGWNELPDTAPRPSGRPHRRAKPPKSEPEQPRPPRTRGQRVRRLLLALFLIFVVLPSLLFVLAYWSAEIPAPGSVQANQIATVTASDGTTVLAKVVPPEGNRTPVPLSDVPQAMRDAILSAEDRNFYTNPGYSAPAFLRAARDNLLGREDAGGGSTITQQYVKNAFLSSERTLSRKMRELIISAKMARQWSKDDILAAYLNTIYYGRGAYGIAAAAKAYFDKPVPQLTLAESAVLAAVVRTPSILDPETHLDQLRARWNYVLDGMVTMHTLSPADRAAAQFPPIVPVAALTDDAAHGPAGLIRTQVLRELRAAGVSEEEINTGALQIVTTIDPRAQQAALDAVHQTLDGQPTELRSAVVSIDPRSGAVRAYYGGEDGVGFDDAQAPLQTGSAFKTFAVLAALQQGITMSYQLDSSPLTVNGVKVTNVEGESCGTCSLAEAFKRSLNTSFYRLSQAIGPQTIADAAHRAGIPDQIPGVPGKSLTDNGAAPQPSIVLGVYSVRPIDMASAYATIAAGGVYHQPYFVQRVVTGDGRVLLDRGVADKGGLPAQQRIPRAVADTTTGAMQPIAAYSNGHALAGRPSAAKTGTTQLGDTGDNKDAWMIGFTPSLSTAVWVGTEQSQPIRTARGAPVYGAGLPADIWKRTMDGALAGTPVEQFAAPEPAAGTGPFGASPAPAQQGGGGPFDVLAPPTSAAPNPVIIIPPAPPEPKQVEIFPGLSIPVPG